MLQALLILVNEASGLETTSIGLVHITNSGGMASRTNLSETASAESGRIVRNRSRQPFVPGQAANDREKYASSQALALAGTISSNPSNV